MIEKKGIKNCEYEYENEREVLPTVKCRYK